MAMPSDLDTTLAALADPTRRAILQRLSLGEARVTELARPFAMSLNSVSKHIRMLERARLVRRRRAGREHLLSFDPGPLDEAAAQGKGVRGGAGFAPVSPQSAGSAEAGPAQVLEKSGGRCWD